MTSYTIQPIYISGYINGRAFREELKASSVSVTMNNVSEVLQAVDGTSTYMHRAYKNVWSVSWQYIIFSGNASYPLSTVQKLREIYTSFASVNTQIVFGMEEREYPVFFEPNSWSAELAANSVSMTNKPYYNVSFRVVEI